MSPSLFPAQTRGQTAIKTITVGWRSQVKPYRVTEIKRYVSITFPSTNPRTYGDQDNYSGMAKPGEAVSRHGDKEICLHHFSQHKPEDIRRSRQLQWDGEAR